MGPLTVEFREGMVRFEVADTSLTASYDCNDGEISGSSASGVFRGHFDALKGTLTWNGHEYERVK
jgi:hypothetical protein